MEYHFLILLKLFFFFKINVIETEAQQYLLWTDYESRSTQCLEGWLKNLGGGAAQSMKENENHVLEIHYC
jgi:hypothetical protein